MVKSLVSKLSAASSNLSIASTISSAVGHGNNSSLETNYAKHRNDPGRFFGDGVQFKAKLIGILEVGEARGDRMCQEALQDLKMAIRAAGEHKQRITIHVTIDGLRLRDEKTGDSLYHHPVHKISFIAQDMTDSRAFGYIFGSPDSGHRFFGIKTDKAASQVVLAMRDLFQVVFELKKKEIELARQQIQSKSIHDHQLTSLSSLKNTSSNAHNDLSGAVGGGLTVMSSLGSGVSARGNVFNSLGSNLENKGASKELSPESVADLVDLEQELSSLQRGITQMERITPNEPGGSSSRPGTEDDPFGDSFTNFPTFNLRPPPESGRRNKTNKLSDGGSGISSLLSTTNVARGSPSTLQNQDNDDESWLNELEQRSDVFDTTKTGIMGIGISSLPMAPLAATESTTTPTQAHEGSSFGEIELCSSLGGPGISMSSQGLEEGEECLAPHKSDTTTTNDVIMMPHDTDPFSPTRKKSDPDPFQEGDIFSKLGKFDIKPKTDQQPQQQQQHQQGRMTSPQPSSSSNANTTGTDVFNGPLQVSLPPESAGSNQVVPDWRADISHLERPASETSSTARSRPTPSAHPSSACASSYAQAAALKQQTVDVISSISNKKMPHLFGQARFSKRDSNTINMRRLQESDSLSENETAPEPPPRPDSSSYVEPPPLPPKKQFNDIVIRPRVTSASFVSSSSSSVTANRYESLSSATKYSPIPRTINENVPPIPLPSRRVGRSDGAYPGPGRPRKPGHTEDDYLAPISSCQTGSASSFGPDVPPLLPPPTQMSSRARAQRQQSLSSRPPHDIYENKEEILQQQQELMKQEKSSGDHTTTIAPDITLTQLLTLGIDELAMKLNVPPSKLNTMTLVELTSYLSDYLSAENSKPKVRPNQESNELSKESAGIFKVNFDQQSTFVAKFDDTFGEDINQSNANGGGSFVANFEQFNEPPVGPASLQNASSNQNNVPSIPPADRYAVFREIIDQELQQLQENTDLMGDLTPPAIDDQGYKGPTESQANMDNESDIHFEVEFDNNDLLTHQTEQAPSLVLPKIDTKITEVVAQAKDRYAALRDIILVENLFDKKPSPAMQDKSLASEFTEFSDEFNEDQDLKQIMDDRASSIGTGDRLGIVDSRGLPAEPSSSAVTVEDDDDEDEDGAGESSADSNDKDGEVGEGYAGGLLQDRYEKLSTSTQQLDSEKAPSDDLLTEENNQISLPIIKQDNKFLTVSSNNGLSGSKDDLEIDELMQRAISNLSLDSRERISPANSLNANAPRQIASAAATLSAQQSQYNDMSTSPIPLQKSPISVATSQQKSPISTSQQVSPIPSQLSAVSQLIDTVSKQVNANEKESSSSKMNKDSWATFDTPKQEIEIPVGEKTANRSKATVVGGKQMKSSSLHLPPPPPSNTSQNDTAESPCSSDPRDEGWRKGPSNRRWPKKDRQNTSSSSRDISPWDDEAPDYQKHKRLPPSAGHPDRHGYYMRHARRMNSCDEDYDYEEEFPARRDQRKFKHGLSRSRDNFDLDSPSWYHHQQQGAYTWSSQEIEQAARFFDRGAYERTSYGPPLYDKRGVAIAPPHSGTSSYDRRSGVGPGYDDRKYYRVYPRPNYDFEEYGESPPIQDRGIYRGDSGSFEKIKMGRRSDYENVYDEGSRYKSRAEYMYERDRKSFDRESLESFESSSRRRRSFGSGGDMYGSLESRDEFRDRYMGGNVPSDKTRSLRRGQKLRVAGDIDYEQDSEGDFQHPHPRGRVPDSRNLQRPNQLATAGMPPLSSSQTRIRKSSGSSPWDGEEPPALGQKAWKRPVSAADSERRLADSRRTAAINQTPSGSDGEKDRRFRKKQRPRAKDLHVSGSGSGTPAGSSSGRYGNIALTGRNRDNFEYMACDDDIDDDEDYVDDEPPTDEDKFERLNRRRHEVHQRMHDSERRPYGMHKMSQGPYKTSSAMSSKKYQINVRNDYDFDGDYEHTPTPHSNASSAQPINSETLTKFSFDGGFESDFNQSSPPPAPAGTASSCTSTPAANVSANNTPSVNKTTFRFSNDFSDRERANLATSNTLQEAEHFEIEPAVSPATSHATPPIQQKLRFDDKVKVSKFDDAAFEDDFSKASFDFDKEDQWHIEPLPKTSSNGTTSLQSSISAPPSSAAATAAKKQTLRNNKLQQRQELIKKSESINIFAKKTEDPFEDDEFFKAPTSGDGDNEQGPDDNSGNTSATFQWDDENNFAKFDKNM